MKVWLLWESEANDHQVIGVFATEKGAKAHAEARHRNVLPFNMTGHTLDWEAKGPSQEASLRIPLGARYYWLVDPAEVLP